MPCTSTCCSYYCCPPIYYPSSCCYRAPSHCCYPYYYRSCCYQCYPTRCCYACPPRPLPSLPCSACHLYSCRCPVYVPPSPAPRPCAVCNLYSCAYASPRPSPLHCPATCTVCEQIRKERASENPEAASDENASRASNTCTQQVFTRSPYTL